MAEGLLLISVVILLCILFHKLSSKVGLPMLLAFIGLGMLFGTDGVVKIYFENYRLTETVCSVALIFIMFYGGFGTSWKEARPVAAQAILLSTLGVVLTAALTGLFCYFVLRLSLMESFLIGSVISSTDAASVFSILRSKRMGLKYRTASLLEMESGSNDPVAYMLTAVVLSVMGGSASASSIAYTIFAQIFFGLLFAVLISVGARFVLKKVDFAVSGFDMAFVIGVALLSYALPGVLGGNGYLCAYITGIVLGNTNFRNKKSLVHFFDGVTGLMQMLIFFLLGLLATPSRLPEVFLTALAVMLFLTLLGRPAAVFALMAPLKARVNQMLLVSFAGLRGAASIVFAIMATTNEAYISMDVYHIVFCLVLMSILFQGTLLPAAAKKLDMVDSDSNVMKTFSDYSEAVDLRFITLALTENHPWIGRALKDIFLTPGTLVVMILRDGKKLVPNGSTVFQLNDVAVLSARIYRDIAAISLTEHRIEPKSRWIGTRIAEYSPKSGELVLMILRGEETIVPNGDTVIREGDLLVMHSS